MSRTTARRALPEPEVAGVAALIGDPGRAAMLCALMGGNELPASDLAQRAGVAPNAASAHLSKLVAGGLLTVRAAGRQRLFRLSGPDVGRAIEALSVIAPPAKIVSLSQSRIANDLRVARSCYDHLAGRLGVAVTAELVRRDLILPARSKEYQISARGNSFFGSIGVDVECARQSRRHFARECLDWSERRPHMAGALGAALCTAFLDNGWLVRAPSSRALRIMPAGRAWLRSKLAIEIPE